MITGIFSLKKMAKKAVTPATEDERKHIDEMLRSADDALRGRLNLRFTYPDDEFVDYDKGEVYYDLPVQAIVDELPAAEAAQSSESTADMEPTAITRTVEASNGQSAKNGLPAAQAISPATVVLLEDGPPRQRVRPEPLRCADAWFIFVRPPSDQSNAMRTACRYVREAQERQYARWTLHSQDAFLVATRWLSYSTADKQFIHQNTGEGVVKRAGVVFADVDLDRVVDTLRKQLDECRLTGMPIYLYTSIENFEKGDYQWCYER